MSDAAAISIKNLTFTFSTNKEPVLQDINIQLPPGSRTLLIGANGAGKSTLLQILAGKRLLSQPETDVRIHDRDVFRGNPEGVVFLGTEWAMNPVIRGDILVSEFLDSVGGYRYKERRDLLLDILDVDLDWRMHQISDGERRRVQLVMGLMTNWTTLLLDEVTVDLDVLVRDNLLTFLKQDSLSRSATILYATHIFDGLNYFPTHIAHMRLGRFVVEPKVWHGKRDGDERLYDVALGWLKEDRQHRQIEEESGRRKGRGARRDQLVPSDSEAFYRKYDYSH